jgi:hypothetical protein
MVLVAYCLVVAGSAPASDNVVITVSDPDGAAARVGAPVSTHVDMESLLSKTGRPPGWFLSEIRTDGDAPDRGLLVPLQFQPDSPRSKRGTLRWIMPPGPEGDRRFRFVPVRVKEAPALGISHDRQGQRIEFFESGQPVLRYNHGNVPIREGTHPHFAAGASYERGDYISPLYGPHGEELTEDYPRDHPHHRGVWWSWPVTRWKDQIADIWAVVGVWSKPVAIRRLACGMVYAVIEAENVWKFGKEEIPIVREEVIIRAFRQTENCRFIDVEIRLTAMADDVAIGGRPKRGYGGFALRAAPCEERQITLHTDPETATPRRSWIDYSGAFQGGKGMAGVAVFEHIVNPDYPNPLHEYPQCNCVMPAYPDKREVVLSKDEPLVLKHRLWVHTGGADEAKLADVWTCYANPPEVTITSQ